MRNALFSCDAIHLSGGNTYQFLRWLRKRDLLTPLQDYAARGGVLIGVSAGAILMTPKIDTTLLAGDTFDADMTDYSALGLVDFVFVPHFGQVNVDVSDLKVYSQQHQTTVYGCPDDAGIIIDNDKIVCIGQVVIVTNGEVV